MEHALNLQLSIPDAHHTYLTSQGNHYSPPISGVISIASPCAALIGALQVDVSLIRVITSETRAPRSILRYNSRRSLQRLKKHVSIQSREEYTSPPDKGSSIETVVHCILSSTPHRLDQNNGKLSLDLPFSLPIPDNIPSTTQTTLGNVSYLLRASASSTNGATVDDTREIKIIRHMVLPRCEPLVSRRQYRNSPMTAKLHLIPTLPQGLETHMSYRAHLVTRPMTMDGPRKTEIRYVIVKELKWQVQETVNVLEVSSGRISRSASSCKAQQVRQLCGDNIQGRWNARKGPQEHESKDDQAEFNFEITVPKDSAAIGDVDLSSYDHGSRLGWPHRRDSENSDSSRRTIITVDHQLKLDVITGEDTFDKVTGKLVDRKALFKSFSTFFPIAIHEVTSEAVFDVHDALPRYEDATVPPLYEGRGI